MSSQVKTGPPPPSSRSHGNTEDVQVRFASLSGKIPVDKLFRHAFMKSKMRLAHTHPAADLAARDEAVRSVITGLGPEAQDLFGQPVQGGVGYGLFYTPAFKTGWSHGTSFACDLVAPTPPGGNVYTYLDLTATNRSGLGVEAFVSYNGQSDTRFRIFDWARDDHWQADVAFGALGNYLQPGSAHGHRHQVLPLLNSTWRLNRADWRNQVLLYNHARGGWDLVYQHDYAATDVQQKASWVGSWSPIVEVFQALYNHTHQVGALATQLVSADDTGQWGSWALLSASNSTVRTDNVGFSTVFLDPNHSFAVNS